MYRNVYLVEKCTRVHEIYFWFCETLATTDGDEGYVSYLYVRDMCRYVRRYSSCSGYCTYVEESHGVALLSG